jgi:hypothetical protein
MESDYWLDVCCVTKGGHISAQKVHKKTKYVEFLFPYVGCMLESFLPFKCTDFMCQGIMTNPVLPICD